LPRDKAGVARHPPSSRSRTTRGAASIWAGVATPPGRALAGGGTPGPGPTGDPAAGAAIAVQIGRGTTLNQFQANAPPGLRLRGVEHPGMGSDTPRCKAGGRGGGRWGGPGHLAFQRPFQYWKGRSQ
jgi:hypothetical protein